MCIRAPKGLLTCHLSCLGYLCVVNRARRAAKSLLGLVLRPHGTLKPFQYQYFRYPDIVEICVEFIAILQYWLAASIVNGSLKKASLVCSV